MQFCDVVAALLGNATHAVAIVLVSAIGLPWTMVMVTTNLESISVCSKLKVH